MCVYLDRGLYEDYRKKVYRISYGGFENTNILYENYFETCEMYEICEFKILEYKDKFYFFGTSRNGDWCGYKISEEKAKFLIEQNFNYIVNEFAFLSEV